MRVFKKEFEAKECIDVITLSAALLKLLNKVVTYSLLEM